MLRQLILVLLFVPTLLFAQTKSLPNVPDGEYVVIQYQTIFSGKQSTETLTLSKSKTGWVVIGYFINSLGQ
ncbi:TPA: DUF4019 domain-containing protein [Vibrio parahaemolyticus]